MKIVNQGRVDFKYRLTARAPVISKTIFSNAVSTTIIKNMLQVEKQVDKITAVVMDILTYTTTISNISNATVNNVFFKDSIPEGSKFIQNSIKINGVKKRCITPKCGFNIGAIQTCSSLIITFKVAVLPNYSLYNLSNSSEITYDYVFNIEVPPTRIQIEANKVCTFIENKLFKQFSISNSFKIPLNSPQINRVVSTKIKTNIVNTKIVATRIKATPFHCDPTLCKLIIIGTIEYKVLYKYRCMRQKSNGVKTLTFKEGFSCFLLVPYGVHYCDVTHIQIITENTSTYILNPKRLFIDTTVLVNLR